MAGNQENTVQYHVKVAEQLHTIGKTIGHNVDNMVALLNNASNHNDHHFDALNSKMDSLLQKMDVASTENTIWHEAYHASREETALLKAAVDTLMKKLDENITISAPASAETVTTSSMMEKTTMQLSHVQHDIPDVLHTVRNPPGKRQRCAIGQDHEPMMRTNRPPTTQ
jgi:hypothetical protein